MATVVVAVWSVAAPGVEIGVEAGWCWATQDFDCIEPYEYETDEKKGARYGLFAEFDLNPQLSVVVGLHRVEMGMDYSWGFYTVQNKVNYVSIPVVLRARTVPEPAEVCPYVSAGPRFDILTSTEVDPWFESMYEEFARVGLGADLSAGCEFGWLRIEGRWSVSLTDARPDEPIYKVTNYARSLVFAAVLPPLEDWQD